MTGEDNAYCLLLMTLYRLRCNMNLQHLSYPFNVSPSTVSNIIITWKHEGKHPIKVQHVFTINSVNQKIGLRF